MDAANGQSRLHPWRARWRELGTKVKVAGMARVADGSPRERKATPRPEAADRAGRRSDRRVRRPAGATSWTDAVEQARLDWMHARSYFDSVEDPDLIDHAIYQVQAAESRYMYLLRKVRENYEQKEESWSIDRPIAHSTSR